MHTYVYPYHAYMYVLFVYPFGCLGNLDVPINIFIIYCYVTT